MKHTVGALVACGLAVAALSSPVARAAEMGDFCWQTDKGTVMRFSLTESGTGHYTYTGVMDDGDGSNYAIIGQASLLAGGTIEGSFSGSLSTPTTLKTGTWHVTFANPSLAATIEGIRQVYVRNTDAAVITSGYRTNTAVRVNCP